MAERLLVTGVLGCVGAWVARAALDDGREVVGYDLGATTDRASSSCSGTTPTGSTWSRATSPISPALERTLDEHADHPRRASRRAPGAVRPCGPAARDERQRGGHGQRLRGRLEAARPDPGRRVRELRCRLRPVRPLPRAGERRDEPGHAVRRLEARRRGHGTGVRRRRGPPLDRAPPVHRLRARPRPGADLGAHGGDARSGPRRAVRDRLLGDGAVRLRARPRPRIRDGGGRGYSRRAPSTTRPGQPPRSRRSSRPSSPPSRMPRSRAAATHCPSLRSSRRSGSTAMSARTRARRSTSASRRRSRTSGRRGEPPAASGDTRPLPARRRGPRVASAVRGGVPVVAGGMARGRGGRGRRTDST